MKRPESAVLSSPKPNFQKSQQKFGRVDQKTWKKKLNIILQIKSIVILIDLMTLFHVKTIIF